MKTVRRDKLLRLAEAGKLVLVRSYSFDDLYGSEREWAKETPVKMRPSDAPPDWYPTEGTCWLRRSDFESESGRAYEAGGGVVHLRVHSNLNYDFRVIGG